MSFFSKLFTFLFALFLLFSLSGCSSNEEPQAIAEQFWAAAQQQKLEQAKNYVSWETATYLQYLADEKLTIAHVDLGKVSEQAERVDIETVIVLKREEGDDIRIPTKTVLIKTEEVWRVQLQKTLIGILSQTANKAAGQFGEILSQSLNELDKALSESVDSMSRSLEQGAQELSRSLEESAGQFGQTLDELRKDLEEPSK